MVAATSSKYTGRFRCQPGSAILAPVSSGAPIEALDSVYRRAEDDWQTYYQSGHGRNDFPNLAEWRQHVRTVNADIQRA